MIAGNFTPDLFTALVIAFAARFVTPRYASSAFVTGFMRFGAGLRTGVRGDAGFLRIMLLFEYKHTNIFTAQLIQHKEDE